MDTDYLYYKEKLEGDYKNKFEQVESYCQLLLDYIDSDTKEDILSDILDTFLSAQRDNVPIEKIIGDDVEKFCEDACSDLPIKYKIKYILDSLKLWGWVLLIVEIPTIISGIKNNNFMDKKTEIGSFLVCIVVSIIFNVIYVFIAKKKIKKDIKNNKISNISKTIIPVVGAILTFIIVFWVINFIDYQIPTWIVLIFCILFIVIHKLCYKKKKSKKNSTFTLQVIEEMVNQLKIDFAKINKKNIKKGKKELTEEEFLIKEIRTTEKRVNPCKLVHLIPLLMCLIATIPILLEESILDAILYFLLIHMISLIIYIKMDRALLKYNKIMLKKYRYWKDNNISMDNWK